MLAEGETMRRVSVTDGQRTIGSVVERDDGCFEAISAASHSVGIFHSEPAAATELWRHDRGMPSSNAEGKHVAPPAAAREVAAERDSNHA
jgi:hypothetical protein